MRSWGAGAKWFLVDVGCDARNGESASDGVLATAGEYRDTTWNHSRSDWNSGKLKRVDGSFFIILSILLPFRCPFRYFGRFRAVDQCREFVFPQFSGRF